MDLDQLTGRRIAILGAGREGLATAHYLRSQFAGINLTLISESPPEASVCEKLDPRDRLLVCPFSNAGLIDYDLLIRSPGVSPYRPELMRARASGVGFTSPSNLWFATHSQARTIAVTGTKGKSTTSAMIAHILRASGLRVCLAGNIGLPLLGCDDRGVDWWVIELSSYQLTDLEASPTVGVLLNFSPEHLDWHGSEAIYRRDKFRLVELCGPSSLIMNGEDSGLTDAFSGRENVRWFNTASDIHVHGSGLANGERLLPVKLPPNLPGKHNLSNAAAALCVADFVGIDRDQAALSLAAFRGLPHRMQWVGERGGVSYFNDSISSTPLSTSAALAAFSGRDVTLIVGGLDRGLDWTPYMESFRQNLPQTIIAVPDSGPRIVETMRAEGLSPHKGIHLASGLEEAVKLAKELTLPGGRVLLSPGAPSFPRFRDYRDRGKQFTAMCGFEFIEWDIF